MEVLEKEKVFISQNETNLSFVINNDIELLKKLRESEEDYKRNGISYSVLECYNEHTNLINNY